MSDFEAILAAERGAVCARLARMVGQDAEDLTQEVLARAVAAAPRDASAPVLRAWLHRTARNAGIDALRARARRPQAALDETAAATAAGPDRERDGDAREALAALTPHQRLVLLLRFEAGLSLRELGALLDLSEDAARKRVARARTAFAAALRAVRAEDDRPAITVLVGRDDPAPYVRWLETAGARVRLLDPGRPLDLAGADGLVLTGSTRDVHPRLYGARTEPRTVDPDLPADLRDARALRLALASDLPVVGVCRGAQLLNVLFGGTLRQHVRGHDVAPHALRTAAGTAAHRALGARSESASEHHQAVDRLGRGLRVSAVAPDGLVEAVEVPGRRLVLGTQWHPEASGHAAIADLLVATAAA
jgi:putative glutamine amidotransferase